jgi:hypothetical protein
VPIEKVAHLPMDAKALMARIFLAFNIVALILTLSAMAYTFSVIGFVLVSLHTGEGVSPGTAEINKNWYVQITLYFFAVLNVITLICEVVIFFKIKTWGFGAYPSIRALFYFFLGFAVMGLASDLGIAAGIILIIAALCTGVCPLLLGTDWTAGPQPVDFNRVST